MFYFPKAGKVWEAPGAGDADEAVGLEQRGPLSRMPFLTSPESVGQLVSPSSKRLVSSRAHGRSVHRFGHEMGQVVDRLISLCKQSRTLSFEFLDAKQIWVKILHFCAIVDFRACARERIPFPFVHRPPHEKFPRLVRQCIANSVSGSLVKTAIRVFENQTPLTSHRRVMAGIHPLTHRPT